MLDRNKYWKSTLGIFADVLIAKQVDYSGTGIATGVTDFPTFVSTAAEGEIACFNADTNALISGATTPATTVNLFFALKRDGNIEKTGTFQLAGGYTAKRVTYSAPVAQISKAVFGAVVPTVGHYYSVKVIETTPGYQPFPSWEYGVTAKATDTTAAILLQRIVDLINDKTNVINKGTDSIVTATLSTTTIILTAASAGITFRLAFSYDSLNDNAATATYSGSGTANAYWGTGTYNQVAELEFESDVYKGLGTQYPGMQMARPSDFGAPTAFALPAATYNLYIIQGTASENSPTLVDRHTQPRNILLAIPSNGATNAEAEVKLILGL